MRKLINFIIEKLKIIYRKKSLCIKHFLLVYYYLKKSCLFIFLFIFTINYYFNPILFKKVFFTFSNF
jgi:hypothetical protein